MTPETPEHGALAARLDAILDRLAKLELQVRGLVTSQTVEAEDFVVRDERGGIRVGDRISRAPHGLQVCVAGGDVPGGENTGAEEQPKINLDNRLTGS
jgi:hypothetical protein